MRERWERVWTILQDLDEDDPLFEKALRKLYYLDALAMMQGDRYVVESDSAPSKTYTVLADPDDGRPLRCDCDGYRFHRKPCKHMQRVDPERHAGDLVRFWWEDQCRR